MVVHTLTHEPPFNVQLLVNCVIYSEPSPTPTRIPHASSCIKLEQCASDGQPDCTWFASVNTRRSEEVPSGQRIPFTLSNPWPRTGLTNRKGASSSWSGGVLGSSGPDDRWLALRVKSLGHSHLFAASRKGQAPPKYRIMLRNSSLLFFLAVENSHFHM
jgi:hypothetical protein